MSWEEEFYEWWKLPSEIDIPEHASVGFWTEYAFRSAYNIHQRKLDIAIEALDKLSEWHERPCNDEKCEESCGAPIAKEALEKIK